MADERTNLQAIADSMGEVQATPTSNTLLARLKDAVTHLATIAGAQATTITDYNITLTLVDTEYSQALPANTKKIEFWSRGKYAFRHSFTTGKVAGPTAPYTTAFANSCYEAPGINLTSKTIYFATDAAGDIIEMRVWS